MLANALLALLLRCHVVHLQFNIDEVSSPRILYSHLLISMNERGNDFSEAKRPTSFQITYISEMQNTRVTRNTGHLTAFLVKNKTAYVLHSSE